MRSFLLAATVAIAAISSAVAHDIEYETIGPFDASKLPSVSGGDLEKIERYAADDGVRPSLVVAVSEGGSVGTVWGKTWGTQDRIRQATHLCEHVSQSACGLAVVNGKMVKFSLLPRQLAYPKRFDAEAVPFIRHREVQRLRSGYANARWNRTLALNWNGVYYYWRGASNVYSAKQSALAGCRKQAGNWGNCFLYDVNGKVVFTPETDIFGDR